MAEDRFMVKRLHNNIVDRDGKPEFIENILSSGKNCVNGLNDNGETPLIACVREGINRPEKRDKMEKMMKLFLSRPECDVNAVDSSGRTALMWVAVSYDWDGAVELLLDDPRTDFNYTSKRLETALDIARRYNFHWLVKVLTKHQTEGTKPKAVVQPFVSPSAVKKPQFGALPPLPTSAQTTVPTVSVATTGAPPPPPPPGSGKFTAAVKYSSPPNNVVSTNTVPKAPNYSSQDKSAADINEEKRVIQIKKLLDKIASEYHNLETDIILAKLEGTDAQVIDKITALYGKFDSFMTQCAKDPSLV